MDDNDYLELIKLVTARLVQNGFPEIADENLYGTTDDDGRFRLAAPYQRLLQMLKAFERQLKITDAETYAKALGIINNRLRRGYVERVEVEPADGETIRRSYFLSELPNRQAVRSELNSLIARLHDTREGA
ncbi:hypothetical protein ACFSTI_06585 [Rhizorhabdus histidinilytica]|uniref:Uncharacterized protein n=1 Tax=Rhizorhabdus histidinilytica TaxID=439228 RepID=A0A1T5FQ88_9SPHN|nr:hypothetical protein [Rhizorhabdus histidinilytica]SKB98339.1 hypothetical protein SAMN06295920_110136 [Rhizorhabdus histidinilytica]